MTLRRVRFVRGVEIGSITVETLVAGPDYALEWDGFVVRVAFKGRQTLVPLQAIAFMEPE